MKKCKCSLSISLTGDGCRYCQPQTYIDSLHDIIDEERVEIATLEASVAANQKAHDRYEKLRKMNVPQFADLYKRNISGKGRFDDLVDSIDIS